MDNLANVALGDHASPMSIQIASTLDWGTRPDPNVNTHAQRSKRVLSPQIGRQKVDGPHSTVFIIDGDASLRQSLQQLLMSVGLQSEAFESPGEFMGHSLPNIPSCLILDVRLPGMSGLDFHARLTREGVQIPVIFVTGHGDVSMTVRAMKAGAVDFLTKPCHDQDLLDAVMTAIAQDQRRRAQMETLEVAQQRFLALTARERQVMALVSTGLMNKQVAGELGLSEVTVKVHRGSLMKKLKLRSVADLVRMTDLLRGSRVLQSSAGFGLA